MISHQSHGDSTRWLLGISLILVVVLSCCATADVHRVPVFKRSQEHIIKVLNQHKRSITSPDTHAPQHRHKRATLDESLHRSMLFGNLYQTHEYYVNIWVGSQNFTVQLDTGSTGLAIPGPNCHQADTLRSKIGNARCQHSSPFYNGTTAIPVPCSRSCRHCTHDVCQFTITYGDGSFLHGPLVEEKVTIAGLDTKCKIGLVQKQSEGFSDIFCDGVMGMAYSVLDRHNGDSVFEHLVSDGKVNDMFSMCLGPTAGQIVLGGYDEKFHRSPIKWASMIEPIGFYRIDLQQISLNLSPLSEVDPSEITGAIVDSGTTLIVLPIHVYERFKHDMQTNYAHLPYIQDDPIQLSFFDDGYCFPIGINTARRYPTLSFHVQTLVYDSQGNSNGTTTTIELRLSPVDYLLVGSNEDGSACRYLGIQKDRQQHMVLGDVFMQAFNVIFDREHRRVGFAELSSCVDQQFLARPLSPMRLSSQIGHTLPPLMIHVSYMTGEPVVGVIVEFVLTQGDIGTIGRNTGRTTNEQGIATLSGVVAYKSGLVELYVIVPGSISQPLSFLVSVVPGDSDTQSELPERSVFYFPSPDPTRDWWQRDWAGVTFKSFTTTELVIIGVSVSVCIASVIMMLVMCVVSFQRRRRRRRNRRRARLVDDDDTDQTYHKQDEFDDEYDEDEDDLLYLTDDEEDEELMEVFATTPIPTTPSESFNGDLLSFD